MAEGSSHRPPSRADPLVLTSKTTPDIELEDSTGIVDTAVTHLGKRMIRLELNGVLTTSETLTSSRVEIQGRDEIDDGMTVRGSSVGPPTRRPVKLLYPGIKHWGNTEGEKRCDVILVSGVSGAEVPCPFESPVTVPLRVA